MAQLVSPGVEIIVEDQGIPAVAGPGTIPLIFIATQQDKIVNVGSSDLFGQIAPGTQTSNAGELFLITSQRELIDTFGEPVFYTDPNGTPIPAYELNEYGLHAAYQYLGIADRVWVVRADMDLGQLEPSQVEPTVVAPDGTYWFDVCSTGWGIFRSNGNPDPAIAWDNRTPLVFYTRQDTERVVIGSTPVGDGPLGLSGILQINNVNFPVASSNTVIDIVNNINAAGMTEIRAFPLRMIGQYWFVVRNVKSNDIILGGTPSVISGLGLNNPMNIVQPKLSLGQIGDYAVVPYNSDNLYFEKILPVGRFGEPDPNATPFWFLIGTSLWKKATPTISSGITPSDYAVSPLTSGASFAVSDGNVTVGVTFNSADTVTLSAVVARIANEFASASVTGVFDVTIDSSYRIVISNVNGEDLYFMDLAGSAATNLGFSDVKGNDLFYSPHYQVPNNSVVGDVWIKTTEPNNGANYVVKLRNSFTNSWDVIDAPFYINDDVALYSLGTSAPAGTLYVRYNLYGDALAPIASHLIRIYRGFSPVEARATQIPGTGSVPSLVPGDKFVIIAGRNDGIQETRTITVPNNNMEDLATAINLAAFNNVIATVDNGYLVITNTAGFSLTLTYTDPLTNTDYSSSNTGDPLGSLGFVDGVTLSNFDTLSYVADCNEPRAEAPAGTLWYNDVFEVDIMVNDGDEWRGYRNMYPNTDPNGPILSSLMPTSQSDGTPLVEHDLWIDTSDIEGYPRIYRWRSATNQWEPIDNTDQTTPLGIVFADARWNADGKKDGSRKIEDMLVSDFVDPDAPDPRTYPAGILLFNTRYSSRVVKEWRPEYLDAYVNQSYSVGAAIFPAGTITDDNKGRWVTISGNEVDGSPFMGRMAQRMVIVNALQKVINDNQDIRSEAVFFNLIACPGYPEVIDDLISLNTDKKEIAFIVGDTPARLEPTATAIQNWATNANNAPRTGDKGLTIQNPYVGLYYPWAMTTNVDGSDVVVPPSTVALRTIAYNDYVAYPWFAPAGTQRGLVTNATSVGYVNAVTGEYVPVVLNQGQRDVLYQNKINPIAYVPGVGLVVWGQKTLDPNQKSLDRINVVRLVNFLKYHFDLLARPFLFEPNDKMTRDQVRITFERFLSNLIGLRGLEDFLVVCDESNNTPDRIARNELWVSVAIIPIEAIEFVYIPVIIQSTGTDLTSLLQGVPAQI